MAPPDGRPASGSSRLSGQCQPNSLFTRHAKTLTAFRDSRFLYGHVSDGDPDT
jgi:hypothetical protein